MKRPVERQHPVQFGESKEPKGDQLLAAHFDIQESSEVGFDGFVTGNAFQMEIRILLWIDPSEGESTRIIFHSAIALSTRGKQVGFFLDLSLIGLQGGPP